MERNGHAHKITEARAHPTRLDPLQLKLGGSLRELRDTAYAIFVKWRDADAEDRSDASAELQRRAQNIASLAEHYIQNGDTQLAGQLHEEYTTLSRTRDSFSGNNVISGEMNTIIRALEDLQEKQSDIVKNVQYPHPLSNGAANGAVHLL